MIDIYSLGLQLSQIINQDGVDKTDGEVIDEIIEILKIYKIYIPKV